MRKLKLLLAACALFSVTATSWAQSWTGHEPAEGTFLLYNVGADKFINNGDPNEDWGTNAYLQKNYGLDIVFEANNGAYNLNTKIINGDKKYLATSCWCDGEVTPWTFEAVDGQTNIYTIKNGDSYLVANDALNDIVHGALTNDNKSWWKLVSLDDFKAAMQAKTYSATDPMDVSVFIKGRSFARNDERNSSWTTSHTGGNWDFVGGASNKYYGNEAWNNTFSVSQTITDLPDGTYEVQCSGFGTNGTTYIFGNTTSKAIQSDNATERGTGKADKWAAIMLDNAFAGQTTGTFTIGDGTLNLGIKRETNKGGDWAIWDEFRLYYYGLDLSEFAATLAAAVEAAGAVNGTVPTAAYEILAAVVTEKNKTYTTAADYTAATNAINAATATAKTLQVNYTRYKNVKAAIIAINSGIDLTAADTQVEAATTIEGIDDAVTTARNSLSTYLSTVSLSAGQTIDLTDALIDNAAPGISGNTDYWTNSETPSLEYQLYEFYKKAGATTKQTIAASLPAGNYKLTAVAFTRTDYEAKLSAGTANTNIVTVSTETVNNRNQGNQWISEGNGTTDLVFNLSEATTNLEIGLTAYNSDSKDNWMCWRSFRLVYGDVFEPYTLVEGKMNATVAEAQTTADTNFKSNPSPTTYMAVLEAIAAAQASKKAYMPLTAAINKIDAAISAATTATASTEAYDEIKTNYTNGTIVDADIHTNIVNAYDAIIPVIKSQTATSADFTLAIQNQSFEYGDFTGWTTSATSSDTNIRSTSSDTYAMSGSDGDYLFNTWWQGVALTQTVENLPNGQYTLTTTVASDGATIYLLANGEHSDGNLTADKTVGLEATITFLVKDGNATIGTVGGAEDGSYIEAGHWWYKADNFRLVKNRDLTPEEMVVVPTAIALYNGETEVTEISLDATNNIVTLTPSYTPSNATEGYITWASSDENVAIVADGVVTGVAPGTATITATSTLDETVSATATVTATYPETAALEAYYENDGATRTNYTPGENIIKNGAFEYGNPYYGWTVGTGAAMSAEGFDVLTEEGNTYIKSKKGEGGGAVTSIKIGWPIESGKTYVFSYKIKGNAGTSSWTATSLTNTIGTETLMIEREFNITTDWQEKKYTFTNTDGYAYLQFMARWYDAAYDDFYLAEVTSTTEGNVDYATAAIPTANIGTGAFQYSQDAITAANALVQGTATVADVEAAYEALTTLNAPDADKLYNIVVSTTGHAKENNPVIIIPGATSANNPTGYQLNANLASNVNLSQAFTFTKVDGNNYKISAKVGGVDVYLTNGSLNGSAAGWKDSQIQATTDADKAMAFKIAASSTEGSFNIYNTVTNSTVACQNGGNIYTEAGNADFALAEVSKPSIEINTTEAGYGTVMLPFAVASLPTGVKAYTCAAVDGPTLTLVEVNAIEANKPYIIEGAWNETLAGDAQGTALNYTEGLLTGVYAEIDAPVNSYVLQKQNEVVGFYKVAEGKQPKVPANRAYLNVPASEARAYFFDNATAIKAIEALTSGEAEIYNAAGARQNKLQKGVNIIKQGNKTVKVMVK